MRLWAEARRAPAVNLSWVSSRLRLNEPLVLTGFKLEASDFQLWSVKPNSCSDEESPSPLLLNLLSVSQNPRESGWRAAGPGASFALLSRREAET